MRTRRLALEPGTLRDLAARAQERGARKFAGRLRRIASLLELGLGPRDVRAVLILERAERLMHVVQDMRRARRDREVTE